VQAAGRGLLPVDDGFVERFHAVPRAQAHVLDEAAMVLFEVKGENEPSETDKLEAFKVLMVSWVVTEVLDACWRPPAGFVGEETYTFVHIDPPPPRKAPEAG